MRTTKRPNTPKPTVAPSLYVESWQCLMCHGPFITLFPDTNVQIAHRPDQIACPFCHYIGRFKHWQAQLPDINQLETSFPWPESQNVDAQDAQQRQRLLDLSTPDSRAYYDRTGIAPWQLDQRPQFEMPPHALKYIRAQVDKSVAVATPTTRIAKNRQKPNTHRRIQTERRVGG
jgi:hypothetical protein